MNAHQQLATAAASKHPEGDESAFPQNPKDFVQQDHVPGAILSPVIIVDQQPRNSAAAPYRKLFGDDAREAPPPSGTVLQRMLFGEDHDQSVANSKKWMEDPYMAAFALHVQKKMQDEKGNRCSGSNSVIANTCPQVEAKLTHKETVATQDYGAVCNFEAATRGATFVNARQCRRVAG